VTENVPHDLDLTTNNLNSSANVLAFFFNITENIQATTSFYPPQFLASPGTSPITQTTTYNPTSSSTPDSITEPCSPLRKQLLEYPALTQNPELLLELIADLHNNTTTAP